MSFPQLLLIAGVVLTLPSCAPKSAPLQGPTFEQGGPTRPSPARPRPRAGHPTGLHTRHHLGPAQHSGVPR